MEVSWLYKLRVLAPSVEISEKMLSVLCCPISPNSANFHESVTSTINIDLESMYTGTQDDKDTESSTNILKLV